MKVNKDQNLSDSIRSGNFSKLGVSIHSTPGFRMEVPNNATLNNDFNSQEEDSSSCESHISLDSSEELAKTAQTHIDSSRLPSTSIHHTSQTRELSCNEFNNEAIHILDQSSIEQI